MSAHTGGGFAAIDPVETIAPAVRVASTTGKARAASKPAPIVSTPKELSPAMLKREHANAKKSKQLRLVIGVDDNGKAVRFTLQRVTRLAGDGTKRDAGLAILTAVHNPLGRISLRTPTGDPAAYGEDTKHADATKTVPRDAVGGFATTITRCWLVGFGLTHPCPLSLEPAPKGIRRQTVDGEAVQDDHGTWWSAEFTVTPTKVVGAPWKVGGRGLHDGGRAVPTPAEDAAESAQRVRADHARGTVDGVTAMRDALAAIDGTAPQKAARAARTAKIARGRAGQ